MGGKSPEQQASAAGDLVDALSPNSSAKWVLEQLDGASTMSPGQQFRAARGVMRILGREALSRLSALESAAAQSADGNHPVDLTGKQVAPCQRGRVPGPLPEFLAESNLHGLEWSMSVRTRMLIVLYVILSTPRTVWLQSFEAAGVVPFNRPKKLAAAKLIHALRRGESPEGGAAVHKAKRRHEVAACYEAVLEVIDNTSVGHTEKLLDVMKLIQVCAGKGLLVRRQLSELKSSKRAKIEPQKPAKKSTKAGAGTAGAEGGSEASSSSSDSEKSVGIFTASELGELGARMQQKREQKELSQPFVCTMQGCHKRYKLESGLAKHIKDKHPPPTIALPPVNGVVQLQAVHFPTSQELSQSIGAVFEALELGEKIDIDTLHARVRSANPSWLVSKTSVTTARTEYNKAIKAQKAADKASAPASAAAAAAPM